MQIEDDLAFIQEVEDNLNVRHTTKQQKMSLLEQYYSELSR